MSRRLRDDPDYPQDKYLQDCHEPSVYFIQEGESGPIKIGHTNNIRMRLYNLQPGNPTPLRLLFMLEAPRGFERELHEQFAEHRIRSEWFRPQAILSYIFGEASHG